MSTQERQLHEALAAFGEQYNTAAVFLPLAAWDAFDGELAQQSQTDAGLWVICKTQRRDNAHRYTTITAHLNQEDCAAFLKRDTLVGTAA